MAVAILLSIVLVGCGDVIVTPDLDRLDQALSRPRGVQYSWEPPFDLISEKDLHIIGFSKATDMPGLTLSRMDAPLGFLHLGMISINQGYIMDKADTSVVWLYDYLSREMTPFIDYRDTIYTVGQEIVLSQEWMVWLRLEPLTSHESGIRRRYVSLMARKLPNNDHETDIILDKSFCTAAEAYYQPFDSLAVDGSNLVYRRSSFSGGLRDTEVVYVDLSRMRQSVLDRARGSSGKQIVFCSVLDTLVAWDIQTNYQVEYTGFPPFAEACYSISVYETDNSKLPLGSNPLINLTQNDYYYAPILHRNSVVALRYYPTQIKWTSRRVGKGMSESVVDHRSFDTGIVQFNYKFNTGRVLVYDYEYAVDLQEYFCSQFSPRAVQRSDIYIGRRFLSWQSNVAERHIVYDMDTFMIIELPVYFSDSYTEEVSLFRIVPQIDWLNLRFSDQSDLHTFSVFPNLQNIRVTPIPSPEADYFLFEHIYDLEEPYILVVRS